MMQVLLCTLLAVSRASSRFASQLDVEAAMLVGDERLNFLSATFGDHVRTHLRGKLDEFNVDKIINLCHIGIGICLGKG